jgi:hypothetical protein
LYSSFDYGKIVNFTFYRLLNVCGNHLTFIFRHSLSVNHDCFLLVGWHRFLAEKQTFSETGFGRDSSNM